MSEHESPTGAENRAFALTVLARIEENTGLRFRPILESELTAGEMRRQLRVLILGYAEKASQAKPSAAWPQAGNPADLHAMLLANATNIVPDVAVTPEKYEEVRSYRGSQIDTYLRRITDGLSLLKDNMSPHEAAMTILTTGLASFGGAMIWGTFSALAGGAALLPALTAGVVAMGSMAVVIGVALAIAAEILIFLLIFNKKVFLGMFFNNTSLNLSVRDWRAGTSGNRAGDLFMNTGSMTTFMETHETEYFDSPLVQVTARLEVMPDSRDGLISAGIFCAEKNIGLYGTGGVMLFSSPERPDVRFAFLFACPYTLDNGVDVMIGPPMPAFEYFRRLYDRRGVERHTGDSQYELMAKVGSPRGGEACGFAMLDQR